MDFRSVVMTGLAHDRGLFVPDTMPTVTKEELESWRSLSYPDLAVKVISKFVKEDQVPADKLEDIIKRSCAAFRHEEVTPVISVGGHTVLVSESDASVSHSNHVLCNQESLLLTCWIISHFVGTLPWTHLCVQGCRFTNAWKLL